MAFTKAVRSAAPILASLSGKTGSGKTLSGILIAAGLAGPRGRVGMIDTEKGRGLRYADDPLVLQALPDGFEHDHLSQPYSPAAYTDKLREAESAGITVCLFDSTSHEWDGLGGCCEIAEKNKMRGMPNWAMAKREHKKFMAHCLSTSMHVIFCLRAMDKVKILDKGDIIPGLGTVAEKSMVVPIGEHAICEKSFQFEQFLSLRFDDQTHRYEGVKVPKMMAGIFPGNELITKQHGELMRIWNEGGAAIDASELLRQRARGIAEDGMGEYSAFFAALTPVQKKILIDSTHAANKAIAEQADRDAAALAAAEAEQLTGATA